MVHLSHVRLCPPHSGRLEGITHSLCSLEFENHRPLYDWVVNNVSIPYHKPRQIEFARLGIDHTVMSKRKLRKLVEEAMSPAGTTPGCPPSAACAAGLHRRRHPQLLRADRRGQGRQRGGIRLPGALPARGSERHRRAHMAVLRPVKLTITNYPGGPDRDL